MKAIDSVRFRYRGVRYRAVAVQAIPAFRGGLGLWMKLCNVTFETKAAEWHFPTEVMGSCGTLNFTQESSLLF